MGHRPYYNKHLHGLFDGNRVEVVYSFLAG